MKELFQTKLMKLRKAFKFEILPNGEQICRIKQFYGCTRVVFNWTLA
ncbi:helix-turn-helix domain-containing protein [Bartonella gliris]